MGLNDLWAVTAETAQARSDLVSRFGGALGALWMGGAVLYAVSCMNFAY